MPASLLWLLNTTLNLKMSFVLVLNLQRIKDSFGLCYVFLCHFVCFIMYVTVHAALVRIKLMNNTYRKFGEVWTYGV